jgi:catechol 2,3-dioxygenase
MLAARMTMTGFVTTYSLIIATQVLWALGWAFSGWDHHQTGILCARGSAALESKWHYLSEATMIQPDRIGHVVIKVRNLARSTKFYSEVLGLQVMKEEPGFKMVFLASHGRDHHELAVVEVGSEAAAPRERSIGLSHIAFRLRDEAALRAAYRDLKKNDVRIIGAINHGVTKSIYFEDPDGYELEVYCDGLPEEVAKFPDPYAGFEGLDFAIDAPDFRQAVKELMK